MKSGKFYTKPRMINSWVRVLQQELIWRGRRHLWQAQASAPSFGLLFANVQGGSCIPRPQSNGLSMELRRPPGDQPAALKER